MPPNEFIKLDLNYYIFDEKKNELRRKPQELLYEELLYKITAESIKIVRYLNENNFNFQEDEEGNFKLLNLQTFSC